MFTCVCTVCVGACVRTRTLLVVRLDLFRSQHCDFVITDRLLLIWPSGHLQLVSINGGLVGAITSAEINSFLGKANANIGSTCGEICVDWSPSAKVLRFGIKIILSGVDTNYYFNSLELKFMSMAKKCISKRDTWKIKQDLKQKQGDDL